MPETINIAGISKAKILAALYNNARVQGLGILQAIPGNMSVAEAEDRLSDSSYFDYVNGRVLKINLSGDGLRTALYDRDNGNGAARRALVDAQLL